MVGDRRIRQNYIPSNLIPFSEGEMMGVPNSEGWMICSDKLRFDRASPRRALASRRLWMILFGEDEPIALIRGRKVGWRSQTQHLWKRWRAQALQKMAGFRILKTRQVEQQAQVPKQHAGLQPINLYRRNWFQTMPNVWCQMMGAQPRTRWWGNPK